MSGPKRHRMKKIRASSPRPARSGCRQNSLSA
jgi:hypothetical protein